MSSTTAPAEFALRQLFVYEPRSKSFNYRPNVNARALKRGSTEMLGLVLPTITNPFFAEYCAGSGGRSCSTRLRHGRGNPDASRLEKPGLSVI